MALPTWWTRVWANSRSWWWTGRPGMLQAMGLQRVWHCWAAEGLNWTELLYLFSQRVFASLCPCHDYSLEVLTRDFTYLPCFCCYNHSGEQMGGWYKFLNWSLPISWLRKCRGGWLTVNGQPGSCLSLNLRWMLNYLKKKIPRHTHTHIGAGRKHTKGVLEVMPHCKITDILQWE